MKKKSFWRPDFIIATMAMIIGLLTMGVYIYQARIMNRQLSTSVLPHLQVVFSQGSDGTYLGVENKGVGPAFIKTSRLYLDHVEYKEEDLDKLLTVLTGASIARHTKNLKGRVLSPGEEVRFFHVTGVLDVAKLDSALEKRSINIALCYCSVHNECWKFSMEKEIEPCESCE